MTKVLLLLATLLIAGCGDSVKLVDSEAGLRAKEAWRTEVRQANDRRVQNVIAFLSGGPLAGTSQRFYTGKVEMSEATALMPQKLQFSSGHYKFVFMEDRFVFRDAAEPLRKSELGGEPHDDDFKTISRYAQYDWIQE